MKKINKAKNIGIIFAFLAASILMIMMGIAAYIKTDSSNEYDLSKGWHLECGKTNDNIEEYDLSKDYKAPAGSICTISRKLPAAFPNGMDTLYFSTQSIAFKVYIDENMIYQYGYDTDIINSSPGDFVHFVELPAGSENGNLSIEMYFPYGNPSLSIRGITLVNYRTKSLNFIRNKSTSLMICFVMFILSVVCLICERIVFRRIYGNHCLMYFSLFIFFVALWSITQVRIIPMIVGKTWYFSSLSYISLSFIPLPLTLFAIERYRLNWGKRLNTIVITEAVLCVLVGILNLLGYVEYAESVGLSQAGLVIASVFFIYVAIKYSANESNESSRILLSFAIIFLVFSGVLDFVNSYVNILDDYGYFSRYGLLIFIVCIFTDIMIYCLRVVKLGEESENNFKMAITDALTGLRNRTAYEEKINDIERNKTSQFECGIIEFDANSLKVVNDTYGHNMGDTLIIEVARIIERSSATLGFAYRHGGDEFSIIVINNPREKINEIINTFNKMLEDTNNRLAWSMPIAVAYGSAVYHNDEDKSINDVVNRADKRMYAMKKQMKELTGNEALERALANERNRIAQEMHDSTGHTLTMIQSVINIIEAEKMSDNTMGIENHLTQIRELAGNGIKELRQSINNIRNGEQDNSITSRIYRLAGEVSEIHIEVCVQGNEDGRYKDYADAVCEVFREAVTNCLRH